MTDNMASLSNPSFSLLVVATLGLLLFAGNAEARYRNINPWCKTSDYRALCSQMVKGAKTQDEALTNAVQATLDVTSRMAPQFGALGEALSYLDEFSKQNVISTCKESYENSLDNLNQAMEYLKTTKDHFTVLDRIQTTETNFLECSNAIKQMGGDDDILGKTSKILFKFASNTLAVATQN